MSFDLGSGWMKFWSFKCSLLAASILGEYYPGKMRSQMGKGFEHVVLVTHKGHTSCYVKIDERKQFGLTQISNYLKADGAKEFCALLRQKTDDTLGLLRSLKGRELSDEEFIHFIDFIQDYTGFYTVPRQVVDHIDPKRIDLILEDLRQERLHAEPVYGLVDEIVLDFSKQISTKTGVPCELVASMTLSELSQFLESGKLIEKEALEKRFEKSALVISPQHYVCTTDAGEIERLENLNADNSGEVKGTVAFRGKATGIARIVFDPFKVVEFNEGDVLITGMTRPDYLQLMKKSAAIVTDVGGLLCHAAIVSREIGKPCVIGTQKATKTFKDGDLVEVDATNGTVRRVD